MTRTSSNFCMSSTRARSKKQPRFPPKSARTTINSHHLRFPPRRDAMPRREAAHRRPGLTCNGRGGLACARRAGRRERGGFFLSSTSRRLRLAQAAPQPSARATSRLRLHRLARDQPAPPRASSPAPRWLGHHLAPARVSTSRRRPRRDRCEEREKMWRKMWRHERIRGGR